MAMSSNSYQYWRGYTPSFIGQNKSAPPLAQMPHMWQPNLHAYGPYHCSHADFKYAGWMKWSKEHPDWYASTAHQQHPDWYERKVADIRDADKKYRRWHWDQPSHATERRMDGVRTYIDDGTRPENLQTRSLGHTGKPQKIPMSVPMPKWGLYNPPHYEEPARLNSFPPIRDNVNHQLTMMSRY